MESAILPVYGKRRAAGATAGRAVNEGRPRGPAPADSGPPLATVFNIGDVVTGWAAKVAQYVGNASTVTLADGKKVFAGSSAETETNP